MTPLRKRMLEELQRRNYSELTIQSYLHAVEDFAGCFGRSPDQLNEEHMREYHLHMIHDQKLATNTVVAGIAALRFLFVKTLRRPYVQVDLPRPKTEKRLPTVVPTPSNPVTIQPPAPTITPPISPAPHSIPRSRPAFPLRRPRIQPHINPRPTTQLEQTNCLEPSLTNGERYSDGEKG